MNAELKEWALNYIKNRDLTLRKIKSIDDSKEGFLVHYKDKNTLHIIEEKLSNKISEYNKAGQYAVVVCLNTDENFKELITNWEKFSKIKTLSFLFVNLKNNDKWVISPYIHSMIADAESIESGLRTMFETANGKIAEIKQTKKKSSMFSEESNDSEDDE